MSGLVGRERKAGRFFAGKRDVPEGNAPVNLVHLDDCMGVVEALINKRLGANCTMYAPMITRAKPIIIPPKLF